MPKGDLSITLDQTEYNALMRKLDQLDTVQKATAVQKGLQAGASIIRKRGRASLRRVLSTKPSNVKQRTGNLLSSIATRTYKKKGKSHIGFGKKGHHAHLVDSGTKERYTSTGARRGKMPGNRFWRKNFEANRNKARDEIFNGVDRYLRKIWR